MCEFFGGWKRKFGGITLALACLFAVGWIRSRYWIDLIVSPFPQYRLQSKSGFLLLCVLHKNVPHGLTFPEVETHQPLPGPEPVWSNRIGVVWLEELYPHINARDLIVIIPYWSIVIPLTILAALMLLSKQKKDLRH